MNRAERYKKRIAFVREMFEKIGLDSFLVTNETNVAYLTGFSGNDSSLLISRKKKFFITDSRFVEEAARTVKGCEITVVENSTYDTLTALIKDNGLNKTGFEAMSLPYEVAARIKKLIGKNGFVATKDVVEEGRMIKDAGETRSIRQSVCLTKDVLSRTVKSIRPGITEDALGRSIESGFIEGGGRAAFDPIVAFGSNSSKPHAVTGKRRVKKDGFIMIDLGCRLNGYCADLTRMVMLGSVADKFKKIYGVVKRAQEIAIAMIRPGVKISELDLAARKHIHDSGFGRYFGHALGHGIGMSVHELPSISRLSKRVLKNGMIFTVEPAIYIPGFGGVRIEDMVLVTDSGCEMLTR